MPSKKKRLSAQRRAQRIHARTIYAECKRFIKDVYMPPFSEVCFMTNKSDIIHAAYRKMDEVIRKGNINESSTEVKTTT